MERIGDDLLWSLLSQAGQDPWYLDCMDAVLALEPEFQAFRETLTEAQRENLDEYLAAWEAAQDALIWVAYGRGRADGMKSVILPGE